MVTVTIGGQTGAGAPETGLVVARSLDARYVRSLELRRLARKLNAIPSAVAAKELSFGSRWNQFLAFLEQAIHNLGRFGSDPTGVLASPVLAPASDAEMRGQRVTAWSIPDREYIDNLKMVSRELASEGPLVHVKRAGCLTLKDYPGAIHVGLFAPRHLRVLRTARRLGVGYLDASSFIDALDSARHRWFDRIAGAHPEDPSLYDIRIEADQFETDERIAERIIAELGLRRGRAAEVVA